MTGLRELLQSAAIRSAVGYAGMSAIVKAAAFVKEMAVAALFGVSGALDAYLMALVVIGFPSGLLVNAVQAVFVREYVRVREVEGQVTADRFLYAAGGLLLAALAAVLIAWALILPRVLDVVGHGLPGAQRESVARAVYGLIPYYFLNGVNILAYGALQARKRFLHGALIPIVTPLVTIAIVLGGNAELSTLIGALTLGTAVETALLLHFAFQSSFRESWRAPADRTVVRDLARGTAYLIPGCLISGLAPVIEQTIASGLGRGAISALGFAGKLPATVNTLLVTAVGVTILPYFSEMLSRGQTEECRRLFLRYAIAATVAGLAISALGIVTSEPFVRVAFERGAFSSQDTLTVAAIQRAYLLQVPGALVGILSTRLLLAQGAYRALTLVNLVMVPVVGACQWFMATRWGALGVALGLSAGTVASAAAFAGLAMYVTRRDT